MARKKNRGLSLQDLRRRRPTRHPNELILVVAEGGTEEQYLSDFAHELGAPGIEIEAEGLGYDPQNLVSTAIERIDKNRRASRYGEPLYDDAWCVFDHGEHAQNRVNTAHQLAKNNAINICLSIPSIEIWLLLHLEDYTAPSTPSALVKLIAKHVKSYSRRKIVPFSLMRDEYDIAVKRAKKLELLHDKVGGDRNPSTLIWKLTERISGNKREDRLGLQ